MSFRDLINEDLVQQVKIKFKDMQKAIQKLGDYDFNYTINGLSVKKDKVTLINVPKKESDEINKWVKILKDVESNPTDKTPKISKLDAELKKDFKNGRKEI